MEDKKLELRVASLPNPDKPMLQFYGIMDLDGINSSLTSVSLKSCWDLSIDWDSCFANRLAPYYDFWALRHKTWSPNDYWKQRQFLMDNGISKYDANIATIWFRMIRIDRQAQPIKVDSAFGGLGIHKKNILKNCKYIGVDKKGNEICEHIHLNRQLNDRGFNLYVVPSFINCSWNEHNYHLKYNKKIEAKICNNFKKLRNET
ncbi:hypothetical protein N9R39_03880 [Amylibacter sp.]|nr:hypothetical protein [Amylibacter sp.]